MKLLFALSFLIYIPLLKPCCQSNNAYSVLFYNVENLFDCQNDSLTRDEEFLPDGEKNWTPYRMHQKIKGISKTILACNQWEAPDLIGLCEIENEYVLKQLVYQTGLANLNYRYVHFDSPDKRGIDVAFLYRKGRFDLIESSPIHLSNNKQGFFTRDALYLKGIIAKDTIHLIINHWPSKRGGSLASEEKRKAVAHLIIAKIDSIKQTEHQPKIIAMGDFNNEYNSPSLQLLIKLAQLESSSKPNINLTDKVGGSYKYKGVWALIDHIVISKHWLENQDNQFTYQVCSLPHLLEKDATHSGYKPKRTYAGPRYVGGISDHLPVLLTVDKTEMHN